MAVQDKDFIFEAEAIRDTANHNSALSVSGEFMAKTITVENGLDQQVNCQLQGSHDGTKWFDVGSSWNVAATTDGYQTVDTFFPLYRVQAICGTAPTTGVLDVCIIKARGI